MENYFTVSVVLFIVTLIYFNATNHPNDKKLNFFQKLIYSLIVALIGPLIIFGALLIFGIRIAASGG